MESPLLLTYRTVDDIVEACRSAGPVSMEQVLWHVLLTHDFAARNDLELRHLGVFGFGGKLSLRLHRSSQRMSITASAFVEDMERTDFPTRAFDHLSEVLAQIEVRFETPAECFCERSRRDDMPDVWHVGHHEPDDDFAPVACGDGIVAPGPRALRVPTCVPCRVSRGVGADRWLALYDMTELLDELVAYKTFPTKRRDVADWQTTQARTLLGNPRVAAFHMASAGRSGFAARLNTAAPIDRLWDELFRYHVRVFEAHGAGHLSRFPRQADAVAMTARLVALADG